MKRTIASVLVALVVVLVLSGCGSSKEPDTKLTIWTNMSVEAETIQAYTGKLQQKEVFTTWLNLRKAD